MNFHFNENNWLNKPLLKVVACKADFIFSYSTPLKSTTLLPLINRDIGNSFELKLNFCLGNT